MSVCSQERLVLTWRGRGGVNYRGVCLATIAPVLEAQPDVRSGPGCVMVSIVVAGDMSLGQLTEGVVGEWTVIGDELKHGLVGTIR